MLVDDFSDHLPKDIRNFAAGGGHSLLWPEATTFLSHRRAYLQSEAAIAACGRTVTGGHTRMANRCLIWLFSLITVANEVKALCRILQNQMGHYQDSP